MPQSRYRISDFFALQIPQSRLLLFEKIVVAAFTTFPEIANFRAQPIESFVSHGS